MRGSLRGWTHFLLDYLRVEKRSLMHGALSMHPKKITGSSTVQFEKHQPERRRGFGGYLFCGGGCCCCSCCLHTLGGLIGAALATATKPAEGGSATGFYWTCVLIQAAICILASAALSVMTGLVIALTFLPLMQLIASLVTYVWILTRGSESPDRAANLQTLGSITLWSVIGAVLGLMLMMLGFAMFQ